MAKIKKIKKNRIKKTTNKTKKPKKKVVKKNERKKIKKTVGRIKKPKKKVVKKISKSRKAVSLDGHIFGDVYKSKIRIIGVGGGGGSIVNELALRLKRVSFVVANTDAQALKQAPRGVKTFQFGKNLTQGLGCGMNSNIGRFAAQKEKERIAKLFEGYDLCILVSCLGGGTGSGATSIFAEVSKELNQNTLGVFTLPFKFEGEKKLQIAKTGLEKIIPFLNTLTVFPNEKIFKIIDKKTPLKESFSTINKNLIESLEGLIEMIYLSGLINIDFADFKMVLDGEEKVAYLNSVKVRGSNRAEEAVKKVLYNPLSQYNIGREDSTRFNSFLLVPEKILFNITASKDLKMKEVEQISNSIANYNKQARIIFGVSYDKNYNDKLRIVLLATGKRKEDKKYKKKVKSAKKTNLTIISKSPNKSLNSKSSNGDGEELKSAVAVLTNSNIKEIATSSAPSGKAIVIPPKKDINENKLKQIIESSVAQKKGKLLLSNSQKNVDQKFEKFSAKKVDKKNQLKKNTGNKFVKNSVNGSSLDDYKFKNDNKEKKAKFLQPAVSRNNSFSINNSKIRKTGMDLKEEKDYEEKNFWKEDKKWDIPTFLRRKENK